MRHQTECICLFMALTAPGCSQDAENRAVSQAQAQDANIPTRGQRAGNTSDTGPFEELDIVEVTLTAPTGMRDNRPIRLNETVTVVGVCCGIGAKNGAITAEFADGNEKVISINGPWPESLRQLAQKHPDSEFGAEVQGVIAMNRGSLYFQDPQVLKVWFIPSEEDQQ